MHDAVYRCELLVDEDVIRGRVSIDGAQSSCDRAARGAGMSGEWTAAEPLSQIRRNRVACSQKTVDRVVGGNESSTAGDRSRTSREDGGTRRAHHLRHPVQPSRERCVPMVREAAENPVRPLTGQRGADFRSSELGEREEPERRELCGRLVEPPDELGQLDRVLHKRKLDLVVIGSECRCYATRFCKLVRFT